MERLAWTLAPLCLAVAAGAAWFAAYLHARSVARLARSAAASHDATLRLLRLSAGEGRNVALTLFGHAQAVDPANTALTALARRLLDMSEDLAQQTEEPDAPRHLADEELRVMSAVEFAMAQVSAHLGPSRRALRVDPDLEQVRLRADRRALNQVLVNVLSGAAAATRDGDWIEVSGQARGAAWCIVVQDEGIGVPVASGGVHEGESRGIGLRLTLARSLVQAHGGSLIVESAERVGTRVCLAFPASRMIGPPPITADKPSLRSRNEGWEEGGSGAGRPGQVDQRPGVASSAA